MSFFFTQKVKVDINPVDILFSKAIKDQFDKKTHIIHCN